MQQKMSQITPPPPPMTDYMYGVKLEMFARINLCILKHAHVSGNLSLL